MNFSPEPRHAVVLRYAPWWLSVNDFGGGAVSQCNTYVPRDAFERLPAGAQALYRHAVLDGEAPDPRGGHGWRLGAEDYLQPPKLRTALRSIFLDQPHLRGEELGSNDHVLVGEMSADEWLALHDRSRL